MKSVTILPSGVLQYFIIQILSQTQNPWYEHIVIFFVQHIGKIMQQD